MHFKRLNMYRLSGYVFDIFVCTVCGKLIKVIYPYWPKIKPYKASPQCLCVTVKKEDKYKGVTYLSILWNGEN